MASDEPAKVMCCEQKFISLIRGFRSCVNPAKVTRDGKPYCGVHDPERRKARQEGLDAASNAKWRTIRQAEVRRALEHDACAGLSDDDLRRVIEAGGLAAMLAKGAES